MSTSGRFNVRIDRIVVDGPGLDRAALASAIKAEMQRVIAQHGPDAFGPSRNLAFGRGDVVAGKAPLPAQVAQAALMAVRK
jgi:hypothetical protein